MPKATTCILNGRSLGVAEALALRQRNPKIAFRCSKCGEPVRAHKKGTTGQAAHFEHFSKNQNCELSTSR